MARNKELSSETRLDKPLDVYGVSFITDLPRGFYHGNRRLLNFRYFSSVYGEKRDGSKERDKCYTNNPVVMYCEALQTLLVNNN